MIDQIWFLLKPLIWQAIRHDVQFVFSTQHTLPKAE
ncbi:hypothetical protein L284_18735 [Novosphingobium lindaniclasticum LE124]|uniref:Uncharacterized protein n=1 Tax=Novosphingobium lindaniclasticum LE124 TaxID=1096930 RepID=T0IDB8_9SPHN|nr:hypothetical protein L284_18735 [Novosphingobium lindaniclasticum LE124]